MNELTKAARDIARGAGTLLREALGRARDIRYKGAINLVTDADHAAEAYVIREVAQRFPSHAVLAEESGAHAGEGDYRWIVDPLDGTVNFAHALPHFAVLLAVQQRQAGQFTTVSAATYDPTRDEMFWAEQGSGAYLGDKRLRVSPTDRLIDAVLATGFGYDRLLSARDNHAEYCRLNLLCQGVRRLGSAGLDLAYVACGRIDGFWEYGLKPWDMAGGCLLVTEAGGVVSAIEDRPVDFANGECLAAGVALHAPLRAALLSAREVEVNSRRGLAEHLPAELAARLSDD